MPSAISERACRLRVLRSVDAIHSLLPHWRTLFAEAEVASPFMSPDWLYPHIFQNHTRGTPLAVTAWFGDTLVGLLLLDNCQFLGFRIARPIGCEVFSHLGMLAHKSFPEITQVLASCCAKVPLFDCMFFGYVTPHDKTTHRFCKALEENGVRARYVATLSNRVLQLPSTFDAFLEQKLSSKQRHEVRRKLRKLSQARGVSIATYTGAQVDSALLQRLASLYSDSWQGHAGSTCLRTPWCHSVLTRAAHAGILRVCVASVDGHDVAAGYSVVAHDCMFYKLTAYDPEYARLSAGLAVHCRMIQMACEESLHWLDLGTGDRGGWKGRFGADEVTLCRGVFGRGLRGRMVAPLVAFACRRSTIDAFSRVRSWVRRMRVALPFGRSHGLQSGAGATSAETPVEPDVADAEGTGMSHMETESRDQCQLALSREAGSEPRRWALLRRLRPIARRGKRLLRRTWPTRKAKASMPDIEFDRKVDLFDEGEWVRIRPLEQIKMTLNASGKCHGCAFLRPMEQYCGRKVRVGRRVERFFDEARWRMLKCKGVYLLEGVYCDGSEAHATHGCDRMCFLFWRREWLEKLNEPDGAGSTVARSNAGA